MLDFGLGLLSFQTYCLLTLPNHKCLDWSKLKQIAEDILKYIKGKTCVMHFRQTWDKISNSLINKDLCTNNIFAHF